jgi:hypothetical protein
MLLTDGELTILKDRYSLLEEKGDSSYLIDWAKKNFFYQDQTGKIRIFSVVKHDRNSCWSLEDFMEITDPSIIGGYKIVYNLPVYSFAQFNLKVKDSVDKITIYKKQQRIDHMKKSMENDFI